MADPDEEDHDDTDPPAEPSTNGLDALSASASRYFQTSAMSAYVSSIVGESFQRFDKQLEPFRAMYADTFRSVFKNTGFPEWIAEASRSLLPQGWDAGLKATARALVEGVLPRNLRGVDSLRISSLMELADEGITVFLVPRPAIARRLLNATTTKARRRILGDCAAAILDDCDAVLDECTDLETMTGVSFTRKAIAAARAGHTEAAQALAANTLDTLLVDTYGWRVSRQLTSHKAGKREDLRNGSVRYFMAFAPIWHVYADFWADRGDPVPSAFSRHASAHAVGPRQFTKRATIQAIMLTTSFIAWRNGL